MPDNRNDKEQQLNTLARLFALNTVQIIHERTNGFWTPELNGMQAQVTSLTNQLYELCLELGYIGNNPPVSPKPEGSA